MKNLLITVEGATKENNAIKFIATNRLVLECIEQIPGLKPAIEAQRKAQPIDKKDVIHIMFEFGDHVLFYTFQQGEHMILFFPTFLTREQFGGFGDQHYLAYLEVVKHIFANPEKSRVVFKDLYQRDKN